jgi:bacteriocin-like protein
MEKFQPETLSTDELEKISGGASPTQSMGQPQALAGAKQPGGDMKAVMGASKPNPQAIASAGDKIPEALVPKPVKIKP